VTVVHSILLKSVDQTFTLQTRSTFHGFLSIFLFFTGLLSFLFF